MNIAKKYRLRKVLYRFLSWITFSKKRKEFKAKYIEYKELCRAISVDRKLDDLKNEVECLKNLIVMNSLFSDNDNPYKSNLLKQNIKLEHLNYPTNSYIQSEKNKSACNAYIDGQLNLLQYISGFDDSINKDVYTNIVFDLLEKANSEERLKIYNLSLFNLLESQRYTHLIDKILSRAKEDFDAGIHTYRLLCVYICHLLHVQNEELAEKYLDLYLKHYDKKELAAFLPVGDLAFRCGIKEPDFELISKLFHKFEDSNKNHTFENYLKGKRVAVVGNGPQELGTRNGKKIDEYDEVIRFNNFSFDEGYISDYGRKTTIWSKNGVALKRNIPEINVNLTRLSPWCMSIGYKLEDYKYYLRDDSKHFVYVPDEIWFEIYEKYGVECATGGLQMIYWVKKINPEFSADDCYGFSFKQNDAKQTDFAKHYYDGGYPSGHSFDKEKSAIEKILKGA